MQADNPIGIFDSGVGGLSVLHEIRKYLPHENLIYLADNAYVPYGDKSKQFILDRSKAIFEFFFAQNVKAIVIACNTATAAAAKELRIHYQLPIVAMEPAVKPAVEQTKTGVIGVLATNRTINSNNFQILFARFAGQANIIAQACPGLVEQVEKGDLNGTKTRTLVARYVQPLLKQNADTLVLGCTHYPFLAPVIQKLAGVNVKIIDSGFAIARHLKTLLENGEILRNSTNQGKIRFYSSADNGKADQILSELWGEHISAEHFSTEFTQ
jgi:glutamate racemase